jgi:hypothetical protein
MAIQAMNISIKNNNLMRSKRDKFKRTLGGYSKANKTEFNLPEATPQILREIKERLQEERRLTTLKVLALALIISVGLLYFLMNNSNEIRELFWF